jgi:PAS domain S-box-containing protein
MSSGTRGHPAKLRRALERSLRERGPRARRLLETTKAIPWEADAGTWRFTYVGPQAVTLLGYPRDDWYEPGFWASHIHRDDRERTVRYCLESSRRRKHYEFEYRMMAADGRAVWLHDVVSVEYAAGEPSTLTGFMIDVGERTWAAGARRQRAGRLLWAQEDERRRLARALQDDLTQRLAGLAIETGRLERRLEAANGSGLEQLRSVRDGLSELAAEVYGMARRLRPSILDDLGLATALECECGWLERRSRLSVVFRAADVPARIPADVALCFFRVAQESLRNVERHARASRVKVGLTSRDGTVVLRIRDDGVGFDPARLRREAVSGLAGMEERVHHVGGGLAVRSASGQGTEIEAWAPLSP